MFDATMTKIVQDLIDINNLAIDRFLAAEKTVAILEQKLQRMDDEIRDLQERPARVVSLQI